MYLGCFQKQPNILIAGVDIEINVLNGKKINYEKLNIRIYTLHKQIL